MTWTGISLGGLALATSGRARQARVRWWHVPLGLASAGVLYVTFQLGDRFARRYVPTGDADIREIYALRTLRPRQEIAGRLAGIIGPAEELFWRGLVQAALMRRFGRWRGAALAAGAYGGVHVTSGNFTLMGAAGVAGRPLVRPLRCGCSRSVPSSSATLPGMSGSSWSSPPARSRSSPRRSWSGTLQPIPVRPCCGDRWTPTTHLLARLARDLDGAFPDLVAAARRTALHDRPSLPRSPE